MSDQTPVRRRPGFPYNDPGHLPIAPLRYASGEWLRLEDTHILWQR